MTWYTAPNGKRKRQGAPLAGWTIHDLRRSAVTIMAEQAIAQPHIAEAVVGHVSGHRAGVAGVYNRAIYRAEKAAALHRWADWLEATVEGERGPPTWRGDSPEWPYQRRIHLYVHVT